MLSWHRSRRCSIIHECRNTAVWSSWKIKDWLWSRQNRYSLGCSHTSEITDPKCRDFLAVASGYFQIGDIDVKKWIFPFNTLVAQLKSLEPPSQQNNFPVSRGSILFIIASKQVFQGEITNEPFDQAVTLQRRADASWTLPCSRAATPRTAWSFWSRFPSAAESMMDKVE